MIEHLKWKELVELIRWIPANIENVLFEAPILSTGENIDWTGDHSTHVLEKGWEQVIAEMKRCGFETLNKIDYTVIFKRCE